MASYLYLVLAFVFILSTVGLAIGVRVWLYRRQLRMRRRAAIGAAQAGKADVKNNAEKSPLLKQMLDEDYLEQVDADEIQLAERIGKGTYGVF